MKTEELKPIDTSKYKITETGQVLKMSKEDIMNKISFALKDPILQMGFEVICSKLSRLEKENAELDCQMNRNKSCYSCANATDRCFRNEIGCPCEKYKSYKDENAEMKAQIKLLTEKVGFWEEQTKLKEAQIEEYDRLNMFDIARTDELREKAQKQLNKAKEIIKDYMTIAKGSHTTVCGVPEENRTIYALKLNEEAEQFLNDEMEKSIESSVDHIIEQNKKKETNLSPDYFLGGW